MLNYLACRLSSPVRLHVGQLRHEPVRRNTVQDQESRPDRPLDAELVLGVQEVEDALRRTLQTATLAYRIIELGGEETYPVPNRGPQRHSDSELVILLHIYKE